MRVLVTGASGFLGRRLVRGLCRRGDTVTELTSTFDLVTTPTDVITECFLECRPQAIFHLAARVGGIGANMANPGRFFYDNMMMGLNVLEAARRARIPKVITTGTVCAYPKHTPVPFLETDLWAGYPEETNAPYGIAKKALLTMASAYRQEYGCNFVTVFPVNMYGPGDNFDLQTSHVIPAMIRKFVDAQDAGTDITLWGDGSPTREFLHVDDCVSALLAVLDGYDVGEPLNIGTGHEISIAELSTIIADITGFTGLIHWDKTKPNGQPRRCLSVARMSSVLGWRSSVSLRDGLQDTISWYKAGRP